MGKRWSHFFFNFISIPIIHQYSLLFFLSLIKLLSNKVAAGNTQLLLSTTGVISGKLEGEKNHKLQVYQNKFVLFATAKPFPFLQGEHKSE